MLEGYIRQETEYQSYEDFYNSMLEMDESKILLESAIKTTDKFITSAEYSHLYLLEAYQVYENNEEIITSLEGYQNNHTIFYTNLSQIDALARASQVQPELGKMYNYLYETQGKEKANDYLEKMEETLNQINGQVNAEKFLTTLKDEKQWQDYLENHLKVGGKGVSDGLESFREGISDWLTGQDFYSESEYEALYIMQALQGSSEKHYDWALSHNYSMTQSIGNMLPSIALSMLLTPAVGGSVASTVGSISMGVSAGGKSYHQALVEGHDTARSVFYGVLNGVSEAALQKMVGGIVGLSEVEVVDLKSLAVSMLHEGIEEGSQEYLDALFKYGLWQEKQDLSELNQNAFLSAIYGSLTAGAMNGVGLGVQRIGDASDVHVWGENLGENQANNEIRAMPSFHERDEVEVLEDFEIDSERIKDFNTQVYQEILNHNPEIQNYVQERFDYMTSSSKVFKFDLKTEFGQQIASILEKTVHNEKISTSVKKILKNLDIMTNRFDNFRVELNDSLTAFVYPIKSFMSQLIDPHILMTSSQLNSEVFFHEFGHAILHLFSKNVNPVNLELIESDDINQVLLRAQNHVFENINQIEILNNELNNDYNKVTQETIKWYNEIRESEAIKTKSLIDHLYESHNIEALKELYNKAVHSPNTSDRIKTLLSDYHFMPSQFDDVIKNRELMVKIAQISHNVEAQVFHLNEIMSDFNYYGDSKKLISMISSVVKGFKIKKKDGTEINLKYGHSEEYYTQNTSAFDELFADFFCLEAHGREASLNTFKILVGDELYQVLEQQLNAIADQVMIISK